MVVSLSEVLTPPERLTVSQWAAKYRYVNNRGSYIGMWKNSTVPYMVEPMDTLSSHVYNALIMVASAQCGKTDALLVNWIGYSIAGDPMDILIVNPTSAMARDFSKRRTDKLVRDTKVCGALLKPDRHADNILDKHFTNGVFLSLAHPSVSELAGRPIPRVGLTDYDRMEDDIGGEGSPFDLAQKRTTTFGSYAMTVAESSPSRPIEDIHWVARAGSHEAPPTRGIFALYNRGDRRRWYWPCPCCGHYFEAVFEMLRWNENLSNILELSESVYMECPKCKGRIEQSQRHEMQQKGKWLKDGEYFNSDGELCGVGRKTRTASFWLRGVAAAFVNWGQLVAMYLAAEDEYERTGSENALIKFYNTDLAEPYIPKVLTQQRLPEHLRDRAIDIGERVVPQGVRCLIAAVDVQMNRFVVQVHGISIGYPFDITIIDRFDIRKSNRIDEDGDAYMVRPTTFLEDWDLLESEVMDKTYPLDDGSGRVMGITMTVCDSGGYSHDKGHSTTAMAYSFQRKLRSMRKAGRFHLVKGSSSPNIPMTSITYPDSTKRDMYASARGDVPILLLNSNILKDTLSNRLDSLEIGKGCITFPDWLDISFYQELCAEVRKPVGWRKTSHKQNEAWDLLYYCLGVSMSKLLMIDRVKWDNPPIWLDEWDKNSMVYTPVVEPDYVEEVYIDAATLPKDDETGKNLDGAGVDWDKINALMEDE